MRLSFTVHYDPHWAELLRMNGWSLGLLGNQDFLSNWDDKRVVLLNCYNFREWTIDLTVDAVHYPIEYKYVIYNTAIKKLIAWEDRPNRYISEYEALSDEKSFVDDELEFDLSPFRGAGVAIPVFSLRSKESFGVGEFSDLKKMVDWAVLTGQRMIQTLPVNDTTLKHTEADSYPYNTLSVFALHPMYLRLEQIGVLKDETKRQEFIQLGEQLNQYPQVDYPQVNELKWQYFRLIYEQEKALLDTPEFQLYIEENKSWLIPYAVFCFLRDKNGTANFNQWPELKGYDEVRVNKVLEKNTSEVYLYVYLQYHLHLQLTQVHEYAKHKGVILKGDIPIGVSPNSVDVWQNPELFNVDKQAGAPPDFFSKKGQNWGFPTYNWENIAADDYAWWKNRLILMSKYFDAYRIDHILGFFRIWEIPSHAKWGLLGQFSPAKPLNEDHINKYGLSFNSDDFLKPYVTQEILDDLFGVDTDEIIEKFFKEVQPGEFDFDAKFNTQRKISTFFASKKELTEQDIFVRDSLMMLICQVLFVSDSNFPAHYHPRISYQDNDAFKYLHHHEKEGFMRLYEEFYFHRHNDFWKIQAMQRLPKIITSNSMLCCGEDLGMIPSCVPEVMSELKILSLEIQRMPKQQGQEFGVPFFSPYLSVCTTSTHDMSTIRSWWEEDAARSQRFFNQMLFEPGPAPLSCETWIAEKIIWQHLQSPAMWVVLPLQDWLALDEDIRLDDPNAERINCPDDSHHVWNYRMHVDLDSLLSADKFAEKVTQMVKDGRR